MSDALLEIRDLRIEPVSGGTPIVQGIDLTVQKGEVIALIGESGSGKTTIALSALGYVRPGLQVTGGSVFLGGEDILAMSSSMLRDFRGRRVAYIAQSAAASFNPGLSIGYQVIEPALTHAVMDARAANERAVELYRQMALPDPEGIGERFPHEVSGGQLQRLMAAMGLCCGPELLIFDEPTTALDVTTQVEVLEIFKGAIQQRGAAAIYVSHDLAVVAQIADRIIVLLNGEIQECGPTEDIVTRPSHEYTRILMAASDPDLARQGGAGKTSTRATQPRQDAKQSPLLEIRSVWAGYGPRDASGKPKIPILKDINLTVNEGSIVGVIGESGSGKSTLARVIAGFLPASQGDVRVAGELMPATIAGRNRDQLRQVQMVMQMADVALNPSHTIGKILGRPVEFLRGAKGSERDGIVEDLLAKVKLPADFMHRLPKELSGGQKQRINLARALAANPRLILCDEVTSALDTVVRNSMIDLIEELRETLSLTIVFISHDISTVASLADDVAVMYQGEIVEYGPTERVLRDPEHHYTKVLMAAVPHLRVGWLEEAIVERDSVLHPAAGFPLVFR
jgi:peptide/nickel transport system ATP-binding protein